MAIASPQVEPLIPGTGNDAVDWTISTAGTYVGTWADGLAGTDCIEVQMRFLWGAGSGGVRACLQSSLDQGNTAYDIAVVDFAAVARTVIFAVRPVVSSTIHSGISDIVLPGEGGFDSTGASQSEGVVTSVLGDRFRLKVIVAGTYTNTILSSRILAT
jgi:hypothetical protein